MGVVSSRHSTSCNKGQCTNCHSADLLSVACMCRLKNRVTTCLENLEMSGNLTVREVSGILLNVREKILSGKSCLKLFIVSWILASIQVCSVLNIKRMVLDHALLHSYPTTHSDTSTDMI